MAKISSGLLALPECFDTLLKNALQRFYEARLAVRQEAFKGFEQNVRVMELMKSSPFCRLLFPTNAVKDAMHAVRNSPLGIHAFFRRNRSFNQSSNLPFKIGSSLSAKPRTQKSPAKKPVVFHSKWSELSQPRAGFKKDSGKSPAKSKSPFGGRKGGPYKGKGRGSTR